MSKKQAEHICEICERSVSGVSLHHLIPREEGGRHGPTIPVCQPCHSTIHLVFSNKELAQQYNAVQKLKEAPALQKYLHWIRNRNLEKISNRRGKR